MTLTEIKKFYNEIKKAAEEFNGKEKITYLTKLQELAAAQNNDLTDIVIFCAGREKRKIFDSL